MFQKHKGKDFSDIYDEITATTKELTKNRASGVKK
jgi:hypothetical protein